VTTSGYGEVSRYTWLALIWAWVAVTVPVPFVPSLVALMYCREAKSHILDYPDRIRGRELTSVARAVARFVIWVWFLVLIVFVAALIVALATR
jgi:hypothetical protein